MTDGIYHEADMLSYALYEQIAQNIKGHKMALTNDQFVAVGTAAMQALITCNDSIILTPDEIATRAWELAIAMGKKHSELNPPDTMAAALKAGVNVGAGGGINPFMPFGDKLKIKAMP